MKKNPLVSVIICTKNSQKYILRTLKSVKKQTYKPLEIIVVDNYSTDKTLDIARKYTKNIFKIGPERSSQYNLGIKKSKGLYVYRIDSDFYLEPNVIKECVEKCENESFSGIAIHNTSDDSLGFWSRVRKLERDCYIDDDTIVAVRFMKKSAFDKIGGFDEKMYAGEDYDLHNRFVRARYRWSRINSKEIHLGEVTSIVDFAKQSFKYGRNLIYYVKKHKDEARTQMTPIRSAFIRHYKELLRSPILTFGLIIMNTVKFSAGALGFVLASLNIIGSDITQPNKR